MEQSEIIRMAREAGMTVFVIESLKRFAALVAAREREKCAKVVESGVLGHGECAAAIRARGNDGS